MALPTTYHAPNKKIFFNKEKKKEINLGGFMSPAFHLQFYYYSKNM